MNRPVDQQDWLRAIADKVETDGPQTVSVEGHDALTILTEAQYRLLAQRKPSFLEVLRGLGDISDLDLTRNPQPARDIGF